MEEFKDSNAKKTNWTLILALGIFLLSFILILVAIFLFIRGSDLRNQLQAPLSYILDQRNRLRPLPPGVILDAATAYGIDSVTGEPKKISDHFTQTDPSVFLVIFLNDAKVNTKISYTRFLNGRFLDNKSFTITKDKTKILNFDWSLKGDLQRAKGLYRVRLYTNDIYEKTISYYVD